MSNPVAEIEAEDAAAFHDWLAANRQSSSAVWLIFWKKGSGHPSIAWAEAVDTALCFGWVDSKVQSLDAERYRQYFSVRKAGSGWSRINKEKIAVLEREGRMAPAGRAVVERAKTDGSWSLLDGPEAGIVPDDFADSLNEAGVRTVYDGLTTGTRKAILTWLVMAKRDTTRQNRIEKTISSLKNGKSPFS